MSISFSFKHCEILKYFNENVNKCFFIILNYMILYLINTKFYYYLSRFYIYKQSFYIYPISTKTKDPKKPKLKP